MKKWTAVLGIFLALTIWGAAAASQEAQETKVVKLDVKYDPTTYVNRKSPLILVVSTFLLQNLDKKEAYIPVEFGVGNSGSTKVTLTRAGFTLFDDQGNAYQAVSAAEITKNYHRLNYDQTKATVPHLMGPIFFGYRDVNARFTPEAKPDRLVYDKIDLAGNDVLIDILYFKVPAADVKGKSFELRVATPSLTEVASVTFKVD